MARACSCLHRAPRPFWRNVIGIHALKKNQSTSSLSASPIGGKFVRRQGPMTEPELTQWRCYLSVVSACTQSNSLYCILRQ